VATQAEHTHQIFVTSSLSKLPACLADTLLVKYKSAPYSAYIDYADYFKKVMMLLHEDELKMFLPELKDHLESYQVCLGEIGQWTMKPHKILSIINSLSMPKFSIPNNIFPFQSSKFCLSCRKEIKSGSRCPHQKCGKVRKLKTIKIESDMSNESDQDSLLKVIDVISGN
jgi:hypothetical protein